MHIKRLVSTGHKPTIEDAISPGTRAHTLVNSGNVNDIRRELTFGFVLAKEIKAKLQRKSQKTQGKASSAQSGDWSNTEKVPPTA